MALSPADFAAYSRATGTPYPEDPEERAQLVPEVVEFRRNQLRQPQEGSNLLETLGIAALGLGTLVGAGLAGRRMLRGGGSKTTSAAPGAQLTKIPTGAVEKIRQEGVPTPVAPSKVAAILQATVDLPAPPANIVGRSLMPTTEEALQEFTRRLSQELPEPTAEELNFPTAANRVYGVGYRERQQEPGYRSSALAAYDKKYPPSPELQAARRAAATQDLLTAANRVETRNVSLTDLQQAQVPINSDQFINAVESGEDQSTGRLIKQLNIGDPWGEATVPPAAVNEQKATLLLPAAATSPREKAQSFLQQRFEKLGAVVPGRYRRERIMGEDPQIAEAMELYASTGDPSVLSSLSEAPSSPLTVTPRVQTELKDKEEIPTSMFYQTTGQGEFVDDLFEKDIKLTNRISSLGEAKQNVLNRLKEIDQLEPQLRFAAADEPGQGGYYTRMLNKVMFEKQGLNPDSFNADLGDAIAERDFVRAQMESAESLGSQYKLINRQEGVRPFFEVDPVTNQPIPETLEIRTGRPSVQLEEEKTGGGRGYAMYDPASQTGSSIGVYGIEPRNYPIADVELRPTALQREETKATLRRGEYPKFNAAVRSTPEQKQRSLEVSEALRRANIEGRDPNKVLRQLGFNL